MAIWLRIPCVCEDCKIKFYSVRLAKQSKKNPLPRYCDSCRWKYVGQAGRGGGRIVPFKNK